MTRLRQSKFLERYSRQIILKDIGFEGQKKLLKSKVFIVGAGGLGCPIADQLSRMGVGRIAIADSDKVSLSNIHRQFLYDLSDVGKYKVNVIKKKIRKINPSIKIIIYKKKISDKNINKILKGYNLIIDASDNFKTKFLLNRYSLKYRKSFIVGAISKFNGHIFSFDFTNKLSPCLKCFYETIPSDESLNCETDGVIGSIGAIVGSVQACEALKIMLNIGNKLKNSILRVDLLRLNFSLAKFSKKKRCICAK